jgi:proteasome lid subunit RPN8/RPN11
MPLLPLEIPQGIYTAMVAHARSVLPNECVGWLVGCGGRVYDIYPLVNSLASPTQFESEAQSLFSAEKRRRQAGFEHLANYHSHPAAAAFPSAIDLEQNFYGDMPHFIISLASNPPVLRAWQLKADGAREIFFRILPATG